MIKLTDEDRAKYTPKKKQTNLEKIRAMSAEELAVYLVDATEYRAYAFSSASYLDFKYHEDTYNYDEAVNNTKQWLESEVEE